MHYRRLSHRYAVVVTMGQPAQVGGSYRIEQYGMRLAQTRWRPSADIYETEGSVAVTVELAGVDPETLDVQLFDDALVVEGQRRLPPSEQGGIYHAAEVRQGPFRLELVLPAVVDSDRLDARYDRGLLQMNFAKAKAR
jgi:HSP20 family protein